MCWLVEEEVVVDRPILDLLVEDFLEDFFLCVAPNLKKELAFVVSTDRWFGYFKLDRTEFLFIVNKARRLDFVEF